MVMAENEIDANVSLVRDRYKRSKEVLLGLIRDMRNFGETCVCDDKDEDVIIAEWSTEYPEVFHYCLLCGGYIPNLD